MESTHDKQTIEHVRVYPGTDGEFTLYNDDGLTYACEKGKAKSRTCAGITPNANHRNRDHGVERRLGPAGGRGTIKAEGR